MTVYVVFVNWEYVSEDHSELVGVFSGPEKAEAAGKAAVRKWGAHTYSVAEERLDAPEGEP